MKRVAEHYRWLLLFAVVAAGALAVVFMGRITGAPP
jgi:hypothetical protein